MQLGFSATDSSQPTLAFNSITLREGTNFIYNRGTQISNALGDNATFVLDGATYNHNSGTNSGAVAAKTINIANFSVTKASSFNYNGADTASYLIGELTGSGDLTIGGSSAAAGITTTFNKIKDYSGTLTSNAGRALIVKEVAIGGGKVTTIASALSNTASDTLTVSGNGQLIFTNQGSTSSSVLGAGALQLNGGNVYLTGVTTFDGHLSYTGYNSLATGHDLTFDGATITVGGKQGNAGLDFGSANISFSDNVLFNIIDGSLAPADGIYEIGFTYGTFDYSTLTGANIAMLGKRQSAVWSVDSAAGGNALLVTILGAAANLSWSGGNGNWGEEDAQLWTRGAGTDVFVEYDNVTIGEFGTGGTITLTTDVTPAQFNVIGASDWTIDGATNGKKIVGAAQLVKEGTGTLTLNSANDYTGGTNINGGTIVTTAAGALGAGDVNVATGASLTLGGNTTNNITLNGGDALSMGAGVLHSQGVITLAVPLQRALRALKLSP